MFLTQRLKMVLFIYNLHGGDADRRGACDVCFGFGDVGVGYVGVGDVAVAVEDGDSPLVMLVRLGGTWKARSSDLEIAARMI